MICPRVVSYFGFSASPYCGAHTQDEMPDIAANNQSYSPATAA
jgi:hypothetical protein